MAAFAIIKAFSAVVTSCLPIMPGLMTTTVWTVITTSNANTVIIVFYSPAQIFNILPSFLFIATLKSPPKA